MEIDSTPDEPAKDSTPLATPAPEPAANGPKIEPVPPAAPKRGRPPGSRNRTTAKDATIEVALGVMDSCYSFLSMGLLMFAPAAAMQLNAGIEQAQARNRGFFQADPALAARIAKLGSTGGAGGFIIANIMFLAPVMITAMPDLQKQFPQVGKIFDRFGANGK